MSTEVAETISGFVAFAQSLRRAGVSAARTEDFVAALGALDPIKKDDVYWAGRATLCSSPDDLEIFERLFFEWFSGSDVIKVPPSNVTAMPKLPGGEGGIGDEEADEDVTMLASTREILRNRDVAALTPHEHRQIIWLFSKMRIRLPLRKVRRWEPSNQQGEIDVAAMVRQNLQRAGEPSELKFRKHRMKPRRVVFVIDVSRSTTAYADQNLRLAHRFVQTSPGRVEVFTIGTRLTRITGAMKLRDPELALTAAGRVIPDWSGGTRLGENLEAFINRWGRRGTARGAIVVIMSDGWERGDPTLLGEQVRILKRLAHSVIWVNPHTGKEGFEPIQLGMMAVMDHVDHFVSGHTFAAFEDVAEVVAGV